MIACKAAATTQGIELLRDPQQNKSTAFTKDEREELGQVSDDEIGAGLLYAPQSNILQTEITTAQQVAEVIFDRGLAGVKRPKDLRVFLESQLHEHEYTSLAAAV
ncbi:MAG: hypothetical protein WB676_17950 [Bryobacteraceae bacterium]